MPRLRRWWVGGLSIARRGLRERSDLERSSKSHRSKVKGVHPRLRRECGARQCKGIPLDDAKDSATGRRSTVAVTAILSQSYFSGEGQSRTEWESRPQARNFEPPREPLFGVFASRKSLMAHRRSKYQRQNALPANKRGRR